MIWIAFYSPDLEIERTASGRLLVQSVIAPRHVIELLQVARAVENFGRLHFFQVRQNLVCHARHSLYVPLLRVPAS